MTHSDGVGMRRPAYFREPYEPSGARCRRTISRDSTPYFESRGAGFILNQSGTYGGPLPPCYQPRSNPRLLITDREDAQGGIDYPGRRPLVASAPSGPEWRAADGRPPGRSRTGRPGLRGAPRPRGGGPPPPPPPS